MVATRKIKMHANTIPAMVPELNEKVLLFGGDKVDDEDGITDEASDLEEVGVEVGGVDIRDGEELISLVVTAVVAAFNEMLLGLLD